MKNRYFDLEKASVGAFKYVRDTLDVDRQIDRDEEGDPFVLDFKMLRSDLIRVYIKRDNQRENFTMKPRGRKINTISFKTDDGFLRPNEPDAGKKIQTPPPQKPKSKSKPNRERHRRQDDSDDFQNFMYSLNKLAGE